MFSKECKYLLYGGAMAGGKSFFLRWAAIMYLVFLYKKYGMMGIEVGLFSEDYPTLKDRQISKIQREVPEWIGKIKDDKVHGLCLQLSDKLGGGLVLLRNLDDPAKYMSSEFAGIFVDELTRNDEQTFQDLRNRLRYPGISEPKFVGATNPGGVGHGWVKKMFVDHNTTDPEQERFFYIHANAYDNQYISDTYLKQLESLPHEKRKAYLEGSWDIFAGQFFSEFDRKIHTITPISPSGKYTHFGSMDWGYSAPFCFLSHIIKSEKYEGVAFNRIITYNEIYNKQKSPEEVAHMIEAQGVQGFSFIRCDPAMFHKISDGSMSISDQMKQKMIDGYLLKPANNDRIGGWAIVHNWLSIAPDGLPYWLIGENCKNLIRSLPQLIYNDNNIEDVDSTGDDHAPDAARYGLVHVKFIDAKVGGVGSSHKPKMMPTAITIDGKQVSLNLDAFANAWTKKNRRVYYR